MIDDLLLLGAVGMGLCLVMVFIAAHSLLEQWLDYRAEIAEIMQELLAQERAEAIEEVKVDLMVLELERTEPPRNWRHNLHCPRCGRFSRRVFPGDDTVVECAAHSVQVRWKDIPVSWQEQILLVGEEVVPVTTSPVSVVAVAAPEPIAALPEDGDDLRDLELMGAVL